MHHDSLRTACSQSSHGTARASGSEKTSEQLSARKSYSGDHQATPISTIPPLPPQLGVCWILLAAVRPDLLPYTGA